MPELPEVETLVRGLQGVIGLRIASVDVLDARLALDPRPLVGASIASIVRRGKHILIRLADRGDLIVHLRMSGRLSLARRDAEILTPGWFSAWLTGAQSTSSTRGVLER